jgi:hypothetical protein
MAAGCGRVAGRNQDGLLRHGKVSNNRHTLSVGCRDASPENREVLNANRSTWSYLRLKPGPADLSADMAARRRSHTIRTSGARRNVYIIYPRWKPEQAPPRQHHPGDYPTVMHKALAALALVVAAGSARADECEGIIKLQGYLIRAQFRCGLPRNDRRTVPQAEECAIRMNERKMQHVLTAGMRMYDKQELEIGREATCVELSKSYPAIMTR